LQASVNALKKQIQGLKKDVSEATRRADALKKMSAKRGAAIAKFVSGWDRKAAAAVGKVKKSKKKKS